MLLHRRDSGRPIRAAMREAGLSGPELAERTRRIDPTGRGVSPAAIGFITGTGRSARERCRLRTGWLIADGLDKSLQQLFCMPSSSTSTVERSISDGEEDAR